MMLNRLAPGVVAGVAALLLVLGCREKAHQDRSGAPPAPAPQPAARSNAVPATSPESAILALEDAYRRHDLEGAVTCKDFQVEAKLMLQDMGKGFDRDPDLVKKTADTLELAYRESVKSDWPKFDGVTSRFAAHREHSPGIQEVTEVCTFPDGGTSTQRLLVAKTGSGWKVLNPLPDPGRGTR